MQKAADQTVRSFQLEAIEITDSSKRDEFLKWLRQSGNKPRIDGMVALSKYRMSIEQYQLDADPMLLNLRGVSVDLETGEIKPNGKADYCTKLAKPKHDPSADCPTFLQFIDEIFAGDKELIAYVKRAIGYTLTGSTKEQCFFFAHGTGANGKSVLLNLIRDMSGDYGCNLPMQSLLAAYAGKGIPNDIAMLYGARCVTAMEGEENQKLATALVKQLTGEDTMTARKLRKEFFSFEPKLKLWIATNHKPKVDADDPAIWRRIHLIPFNVVIPPEKRDGDLPQKLRTEMSGILNWAIEGAVEWSKNGLNPPSAVLNAVNEYRNDMDSIGRFLKDTVEASTDDFVTKAEMFQAYQHWRNDEGGEDLTKAEFGMKLKRLGYDEGRSKSSRHWKGVRLLISQYGDLD